MSSVADQPSMGAAETPPPEAPDFRPPTALLWFGVLGGGLAWAAQHVAGYGFSLARCIPTGTGSVIALSAWQIAIAAGAACINLAAMGVCVWMFMRTVSIDDVAGQERRGDGSAPPIGRIHFLAIVGIVVNFLSLAIIVLDGVGAPLLTSCMQS